MAAFDSAIADGVDVITVSLGAGALLSGDYFSDVIAIGSFHAISRGITVVASAGNDGPKPGSVVNAASWLFTVAASTLDRDFVSHLSLGNNKNFQGPSLSSGSVAKKLYPLATGSDVKAAKADSEVASPVAYVGHPITELHIAPSPIMAYFSARGPNPVNPDVLKPDITAPGVRILAAYNPLKRPTEYKFDKRQLHFTLLSGTSMACPHVSGIVGLLKNAYPEWSAAAIRSAIMTTASQRDNIKKPIIGGVKSVATPFGYDSGHLYPNGALDPGLVYDISVAEVTDLNYPSITISDLKGTKTVSRTLKNVGNLGTYTAHIQSPPEIELV
ncbi:unnamed protein product [Victoria cruziana]